MEIKRYISSQNKSLQRSRANQSREKQSHAYYGIAERKCQMVTCEVCKGNFDNGELTGGKCPDCIEEEKQRRIRQESFTKMINSQAYQLELRMEEMRNGRK